MCGNPIETLFVDAAGIPDSIVDHLPEIPVHTVPNLKKVKTPGKRSQNGMCLFRRVTHICNGLFPLLDSDIDSCTMQILWEGDPDLSLSQWKHVLHNTM